MALSSMLLPQYPVLTSCARLAQDQAPKKGKTKTAVGAAPKAESKRGGSKRKKEAEEEPESASPAKPRKAGSGGKKSPAKDSPAKSRAADRPPEKRKPRLWTDSMPVDPVSDVMALRAPS